MKTIAFKFCIYAIALFGIHYLAAIRANGYFDPFYLRFTNGKHHSMIVGTSRAAQGLQPSVLNEKLKSQYAPLGNFSFTGLNSPFGSIYLRAIKKKLNKKKIPAKKLFIVCISGTGISVKNNPSDEPGMYREKGLFLDKMFMIGQKGKPNFDYLSKNYTESWVKLLQPIKRGSMRLHKDGWLEVSLSMSEANVNRRINRKVSNYQKDVVPTHAPSISRVEKLKETIEYLQKHGEVVLVRLPVDPRLKAIEDQYAPDVESIACEVATKYNIPYWTFMSRGSEYQYTDGNHLYKTSGKKISAEIADMIMQKRATMCR